jgi:hypothetical protein
MSREYIGGRVGRPNVFSRPFEAKGNSGEGKFREILDAAGADWRTL